MCPVLLKKTGLSSTISQYYILINDNVNEKQINYYIINTIKLKDIIKKYGIKKTCLNRKKLIYSNGYIINKDVILKYCNEVLTENY